VPYVTDEIDYVLGDATHLSMLNTTDHLIEAVQRGDMPTVIRLLEAGADVNAPNAIARTPLMEAAAYEHPRIVELLLARGANPSAADNNGITALMEAASGGDDATARLLRAVGASPIQPDHFGASAIDYARAQGHHRTADFLCNE